MRSEVKVLWVSLQTPDETEVAVTTQASDDQKLLDLPAIHDRTQSSQHRDYLQVQLSTICDEKDTADLYTRSTYSTNWIVSTSALLHQRLQVLGCARWASNTQQQQEAKHSCGSQDLFYHTIPAVSNQIELGGHVKSGYLLVLQGMGEHNVPHNHLLWPELDPGPLQHNSGCVKSGHKISNRKTVRHSTKSYKSNKCG